MSTITFEWNEKTYTAKVTEKESNGVPIFEVDFLNGYVYKFINNGSTWSSCGKLGFRITKCIGLALDKMLGRKGGYWNS